MLKFYEKLTISIVVFLGVVVTTSSIIGKYVKYNKEIDKKDNYSDRIILD